MPSSISNSDSRAPERNYWVEWLSVLVLTLAMIALAESYLRGAGHRPVVADSNNLWAHHRANVYSSDGDKKLLIVGASRAQTVIDPEIMQEELNLTDVKMLAIVGTPAYHAVVDLVSDPDFNGVILWSIGRFHVSCNAR